MPLPCRCHAIADVRCLSRLVSSSDITDRCVALCCDVLIPNLRRHHGMRLIQARYPCKRLNAGKEA